MKILRISVVGLCLLSFYSCFSMQNKKGQKGQGSRKKMSQSVGVQVKLNKILPVGHGKSALYSGNFSKFLKNYHFYVKAGAMDSDIFHAVILSKNYDNYDKKAAVEALIGIFKVDFGEEIKKQFINKKCKCTIVSGCEQRIVKSTPLNLALVINNLAIASLLLKEGADFTIRDSNDKDALALLLEIESDDTGLKNKLLGKMGSKIKKLSTIDKLSFLNKRC